MQPLIAGLCLVSCESWLQTVRKLTAASKHGIQQLATDALLARAKFSKDMHAKGNMPICSECNKIKTRWAGLERHINNNRCEQPVHAEMANELGVQLQLEQHLQTQSSTMLDKTPVDMGFRAMA